MKATRRIVAVAAGAAITLAAAGTAYADSGSTPTTAATSSTSGKGVAGTARLEAAKAIASARIQGRISTLHALSLAAQDSKYLTSDERTSLDTQINSDLSGLTALATKMSGETTVDAVHTDENAMVDDYRVYMLMAPQTRLVDGLAAETDAASTLQKAYTALQELLAKQPGGGTSQQQSELADMQSQITAAQAAIGNEVAAVLAIQPGPDASSIESALAPVRSAAKTGHTDLVQARHDAKDLRDSLKS
jgi:ribonuclease HII